MPFNPTIAARTSELVKSRRLSPAAVAGSFSPAPAAEGGDDTAEALALDLIGPNGDWSYSLTAEGRTGEVAGDTGHDMDLEPGLIYEGPAGGAVRIGFTDLDISAGKLTAEAPEATDEFTVGVFLNNDLIGHADESFVAELDTATAEFNGEAYVTNLQPNDVIRFALMSQEGNEAGLDLTVLSGGSINIE